jgi:hypothetical protein
MKRRTFITLLYNDEGGNIRNIKANINNYVLLLGIEISLYYKCTSNWKEMIVQA